MLFHLSIDAENPRLVAQVLARLMGGKATPFPAVTDGSWVAHGGDDRNTLIEVYPRGTLLVEGPGGAVGLPGPSMRRSATHFALATPLTEDEVHAIARWEEWPVETHSRGQGAFDVIELWLEGTRLAEILTPEMQQAYLQNVTLGGWEAMLAQAGLCEAA
jgi:hypothetical protein